MGHDYLLQFFEYKHLSPDMQAVSKPFCELAHKLCDGSINPDKPVPSNPERTMALRKLLEAKDCAVRALIFK